MFSKRFFFSSSKLSLSLLSNSLYCICPYGINPRHSLKSDRCNLLRTERKEYQTAKQHRNSYNSSVESIMTSSRVYYTTKGKIVEPASDKITYLKTWCPPQREHMILFIAVRRQCTQIRKGVWEHILQSVYPLQGWTFLGQSKTAGFPPGSIAWKS